MEKGEGENVKDVVGKIRRHEKDHDLREGKPLWPNSEFFKRKNNQIEEMISIDLIDNNDSIF